MIVKYPVVNEKTKTKVRKHWLVIRSILFYFIVIYIEIMALLSASDFTGYNDSYAVPAGSSDVIFSGSVD